MERQSIHLHKKWENLCNKKSIFTSRKEILAKSLEGMGCYIIVDALSFRNTIRSKNIVNQKIAKKVIFTNSPENVDFTMILGVNEKDYNPQKHHLIASSICDATAIAPVSRL